MMYGFGVSKDPLPETLELMEQYIIEFLGNMTNRVLTRSMRRGYQNMQLEDLMHFLKDDPKKYSRAIFMIEDRKNDPNKNNKILTG